MGESGLANSTLTNHSSMTTAQGPAILARCATRSVTSQNRQKAEMIPNARKFQKGQSGNPGGRPKGIAAKAREHTERAVEVLVEGMEDKDHRVRIVAAKELLDRGYGKPLTMTADVTKRLDDWTDDDIDAAISAIKASLPGSGDAGDGEEPQTVN